MSTKASEHKKLLVVIMNSLSKEQPLVSVVMATYNGEEYLPEQIDSIITQSYKNLEIIIQDDGSSDQTCNIIKSYAAKDTRIRFYRNEENLGIIQNFFSLIEKSNGDYIAISDQDDIWEINKISILADNIKNHSLIYTDSKIIKQNSPHIEQTLLERLNLKPKMGKYLLNLFQENTVSGHACLFNSRLKDHILLFRDVNFGSNYMYDMIIATVASFHDGIAFYDYPLTKHRIHNLNNHNKFATEINSNNKTKEIKDESIVNRKIKRIRRKIDRAKTQLDTYAKMFDAFSPKVKNPFAIKPDPRKHFSKCIFNIKLYRKLIKTGVSRKQSKELSKGRIYYLIFKAF